MNFLCSAIAHTAARNNMYDYVILFYLISFILSVHPLMSLVCIYTFCIKKPDAYREDLHAVTSTLRLVAIPPPHPTCMHTNRNVTLCTAITTTRLLIEFCVHLLTFELCWKRSVTLFAAFTNTLVLQTCLPLRFHRNSYGFRPQIPLLRWLGQKLWSLSNFSFPAF